MQFFSVRGRKINLKINKIRLIWSFQRDWFILFNCLKKFIVLFARLYSTKNGANRKWNYLILKINDDKVVCCVFSCIFFLNSLASQELWNFTQKFKWRRKLKKSACRVGSTRILKIYSKALVEAMNKTNYFKILKVQSITLRISLRTSLKTS